MPSEISYYDLTQMLETAAIHREVVNLTYLDSDGESHSLKSFIEKMKTVEDEDGVLFRNGTLIRLSQITEMNGHQPDGIGLDMLGCRCGI